MNLFYKWINSKTNTLKEFRKSHWSEYTRYLKSPVDKRYSTWMDWKYLKKKRPKEEDN